VALETFSLQQNKRDISISISNLTSILFKQCEFIVIKPLIFDFPNRIDANFDFT